MNIIELDLTKEETGLEIVPSDLDEAIYKFYKWIVNPDSDIDFKLHHSNIYYIRAHLNEKFNLTLTADQVFALLKSEGLVKGNG